MELGSLFKERYKVQQELSKSSSASVYNVIDSKRSKNLALKYYNSDQTSFQSEVEAYTALRSLSHFPKLHTSGVTGTGRYIIMNLLNEPVNYCVKSSKFSLPVVLDVSCQLISRLEVLHNASYVHRKLSPNNLMTGFDDSNPIIYLIDFTRCKKFREPVSKIHHKYSEGHGNPGNLRFSSVNALRGIEYSRRDDLESWFYLTIYLVKLKLPWDLEAKSRMSDKVLNMKSNISCEILCKGLPSQFMQIFTYIKRLRYEENPDYCFLKKMMSDAKDSITVLSLHTLSAQKPLKQRTWSKSKRSGSQSTHVSFLEYDTYQYTLSIKSTQKTKSFNGTPKMQRKSILRKSERNETIKGVMPEFKDRSKIFIDQSGIA